MGRADLPLQEQQRLRDNANRNRRKRNLSPGYRDKVNAKARDDYSKNKEKDPARFLIGHYRERSKKLGFICDLTVEWIRENIVNKNCTYCGYNGITCCDRKDPLKAYTMDNCVPSCEVCNVAKWDHISYEDFFLVGKVINKLRKLGKIV